MKIIKTLITALILMAGTTVDAQNVKPEFKKLTCVTYNTNVSGNDTVVTVSENLEVNEHGSVRYRSTFGASTFIKDTTYQLADTLITRLNKVFDGKTKLQSYMITDKAQDGMRFGSGLKFISYIDYNNVTHDFIDVRPFMSRSFTILLDEIVRWPKAIPSKHIPIQNRSLERQIIKCQLASYYAPPIKKQPVVYRIIRADPPAKQ